MVAWDTCIYIYGTILFFFKNRHNKSIDQIIMLHTEIHILIKNDIAKRCIQTLISEYKPNLSILSFYPPDLKFYYQSYLIAKSYVFMKHF